MSCEIHASSECCSPLQTPEQVPYSAPVSQPHYRPQSSECDNANGNCICQAVGRRTRATPLAAGKARRMKRFSCSALDLVVCTQLSSQLTGTHAAAPTMARFHAMPRILACTHRAPNTLSLFLRSTQCGQQQAGHIFVTRARLFAARTPSRTLWLFIGPATMPTTPAYASLSPTRRASPDSCLCARTARDSAYP
jgi:hypothetical protein